MEYVHRQRIDEKANGGDDEHAGRRNRFRVAKPPDGFPQNVTTDDEQRARVERRRQVRAADIRSCRPSAPSCTASSAMASAAASVAM